MAPKQVRVNSVNPGAIRTNIAFASGYVKTKEEDDKVQYWIKNYNFNRDNENCKF